MSVCLAPSPLPSGPLSVPVCPAPSLVSMSASPVVSSSVSVPPPKESVIELPYLTPVLSPEVFPSSIFDFFPVVLEEVASITKSLPRSEEGRLLAQALQRGESAPSHESVVAQALREAGGDAGAVGFPVLRRAVVRLLKARAPGLAHIKASPRVGDVAAMRARGASHCTLRQVHLGFSLSGQRPQLGFSLSVIANAVPSARHGGRSLRLC